MREILFRAKRINNGEWVEGNGIHYPKSFNWKGTCWIDGMRERANDWVQVDLETVCQYTGMTDKNGSKVWENDIIQMFYRDGETNVGTIRYTDECVRFQYYEGNIIGYGIDMTCDMEVIGNVFDNPELMKGDSEER